MRVIVALGIKQATALDVADRSALLNAARRAPYAAALVIETLGAAGFAALPTSERRALVKAAARRLAAAMKAAIVIGAMAPEYERKLLRAALLGEHASLHVARAIAQGSPWRAWMLDYVPDARAPDEIIEAWRVALEQAPLAIGGAHDARADQQSDDLRRSASAERANSPSQNDRSANRR